jgi:hypothetical protein
MKDLNQSKLQFSKLFAITLILSLATWNNKAQDVKIENIDSNLDALNVNTNNEWNKIGPDAVEQYLDEMDNLFYFEIKYKDKVVYRESIKKSIPEKSDLQFFSNRQRFELKKIYIDPSLIDDSDKLLLLSSHRNKIREIGGKKLLVLTNLTILKSSSGKFEIVNPIENMKVSFYKIEL